MISLSTFWLFSLKTKFAIENPFDLLIALLLAVVIEPIDGEVQLWEGLLINDSASDWVGDGDGVAKVVARMKSRPVVVGGEMDGIM